jgi:hypothetical protein
MNVTKDGNNLSIELEEEENETLDHLIETRGSTYIKIQLEFWIKGRIDTVREDLKIMLAKEEFPVSIKELRQRVKEHQSSIEDQDQ